MEVRFNVPDSLAIELAQDSKELSRDMQLRAVAGLVERGLISSGRAAELVGLSRVAFLDWCGSWDIPLHKYTEQDLADDLSFAGVGH
jgi:predicted HTH domain antitoxin